MRSLQDLAFPHGLRLLRAWQSGDPAACNRLQALFSRAIDGEFDRLFAEPAPADRVHVAGPVDLLTLTLMYRLFGIVAEDFYKSDALRFVRSSLMTQRLTGMPKQYISWPVYGFTAEALGQAMIYSDQYSPGTDPDNPRFNYDNWQSMQTPDLHSGIPRLLDEVVDCYHRLTAEQPVLHLSAPYSIAADTFGQEAIISALTRDPDFVNRFLDRLADVVLEPWMAHFFARYPDGWVELSDASGSPFFIGPQNCRDIAIRASRRIAERNPWGDRVYDANYRGDYVTRAGRAPSGRRQRRQSAPSPSIGLEELFDAKHAICSDYVIRLAEDRIPVDFYEQRAIQKNIPLFLGIGATQIDRNSIADLDAAKRETESLARDYVDAIRRVALAIFANGFALRKPPWPGNVYFEDISAESSFELIEVIIGTVHEHGWLGAVNHAPRRHCMTG